MFVLFVDFKEEVIINCVVIILEGLIGDDLDVLVKLSMFN